MTQLKRKKQDVRPIADPKSDAETEAQSISAKYIFLDIVSYSYGRSVEAQTEIISKLNDLVRECIAQFNISDDALIYLPTGDGICIALLAIEAPYDIHVQVPLSLLKRLDAYNKTTTDEMRQFKIRIGVNANVDNVVTDINGKRNVAGAGINLAQRVMNTGDGNQILVGEPVYETLRYREKYMDAFETFDARAKHGIKLRVYQLVRPHPGLDISVPTQFRVEEMAEPRLSKLAAYYFAHAIKNREFIKTNLHNHAPAGSPCCILLYMLAYDSAEASSCSDLDPHVPHIWGKGKMGMAEVFDHYHSLDYWITCDLADFFYRLHLQKFSEYFEREVYPLDRLFITREGQEKLRKEWPTIWKELGLPSTG